MGEIKNIKTMMWVWMAGYALIIGVMMGVALGVDAYGNIQFNIGAMVLTILVTFPLLAPMQLWLSVAVQVVREQEMQTDALVALVERTSPAIGGAHNSTAKKSPAPVGATPRPRSTGARREWKSPFA